MANRYMQLRDEDIIIWGTENYGELVYQVMNSVGLNDNIKYFCDGRDEVEGNIFHGKKIKKYMISSLSIRMLYI